MALTQRRVRFDFDVEFLNGGGIQGQGFRLDIEGETIGDRELGECLVNDLRLLMVKRVRILRKEVIVEPHKRLRSSGHRACDQAMPRGRSRAQREGELP